MRRLVIRAGAVGIVIGAALAAVSVAITAPVGGAPRQAVRPRSWNQITAPNIVSDNQGLPYVASDGQYTRYQSPLSISDPLHWYGPSIDGTRPYAPPKRPAGQ